MILCRVGLSNMTIEELKAEWDYQLQIVEHQQDHAFMKDSITKLLAVAEAAESAIEVGDYYAGPMIKALDDLLEDK